MKGLRALVAALVAMTLLAGSAVQAEATAAESEGTGWREGLSASKPYAGVPEVNLSERLGYVIYSPMNEKSVSNSCQNLCVYLPRTDVKAGEGLLHLYEDGEEAKEIWRTAMNDEASVTKRAMSEAEREILMWGSGTCFEIRLMRTLELGKAYYVDLDEGCILSEDEKVVNPEVKGKSTWAFTVEGEYGVSAMEYRRATGSKAPEAEEAEATEEPEATDTPEPTATQDPRITPDPNATPDPELQALIDLANGVTPEPTEAPEVEYETIETPQAGDQIRFDLVLGGEAATAIMYGHNSSVDFTVTEYNESGEVTGQVLTPNPYWGVIFLDAQGNPVKSIEFR